jgi:hypothetical protein
MHIGPTVTAVQVTGSSAMRVASSPSAAIACDRVLADRGLLCHLLGSGLDQYSARQRCSGLRYFAAPTKRIAFRTLAI